MKDVGGLEHLHKDVFDGAHKLFNHLYSKSSKSKDAVMDKVINRQNFRLLLQKENSMLLFTDLYINQCKSHAVANDSAITVWHGFRTTKAELEETLLRYRPEKANKISIHFKKTCIGSLQNTLEIGSFCALCKQRNEQFKEASNIHSSTKHKAILLRASAYICGMADSILQIKIGEKSIQIVDYGYRLI